ncbi:MAG: peptide deformylase [Kiritimatiellae bacterium]|nr:peptide deformylase [Kiritimatiellia bacterium]
MALDIVKYGNKILREKASPVAIVTPELRNLAEEMIATMHDARGVGLAAQQVGRRESVCVIDIPDGCEDDAATEAFNKQVVQPLVMFNPVILASSGENMGKEGCLSFPNMSGEVLRAETVTCQYLDVAGVMQVVTAKGFLARAIQHETDHLSGILYVDHYTPEQKKSREKRLAKLAAKNGGVR